MKIQPLPDHFWTDTELDAVERQRINKMSVQFRTRVKSRSEPHKFYALSLYPSESYVRHHIGWWNQDAGARFINGLYSLLIHQVSSKCCANYRRDIHKDRQIVSLVFVEHYSKETKDLVAPHIHATLAVHDQWIQKFEDCFSRNFCRDHFAVRTDLFAGATAVRWDQQIKSSRLEPLTTTTDQDRWIGYSSKQFNSEKGQGSCSLYSGSPRKESTRLQKMIA